ncbi:hypothetical protein N7507_007005 [Penicillium longicatenatum]|nr:hypothetical protein N7507_007005 [Penicillium longicatenatum]
MGDQELAELLKLDITLLSNDRSREVVLKPPAGQPLKQERQVIIWTRKCDLTERVYVEESAQGEVRAVKRVAWRDKTVANYRSELVVLGRLSKAAGKLTQEDETELRTRIGTDGYMAPEVFGLLDDSRESSSYTSAVDIWSLGCLLYYALTKRTPFSSFLSLQAYAKGDATFPENPLYERCVSLSGRAFIQRLLLPSPEARPRASKQLLANWIIDTNAKPDPPSALDPDDLVGMSALRPLSDKNISTKYEMGPTSLPSPPRQEMDYFSFELWNLIGNTRSLTEILEASAGITRVYEGAFKRVAEAAAEKEVKAHAEYLIEINRLPRPSADRLRALLDAGANPNILHNGYTALHLATMKGYIEWVTILLQYGADIKIRTEKHENSVLHLAASEMCQGAEPYILDLVRWLVGNLMKRGVSAEHKNLGGHTPLSYAITLRLGKMATFLLESGSRPDTIDFKGRTPLHLAVTSGKVSAEFVGRLIKSGASVNQEDMHKHSPLFVAASSNVRGEVINLLLDCGADCEFEDAVVMRRIQRVKYWRKIKIRLFKFT